MAELGLKRRPAKTEGVKAPFKEYMTEEEFWLYCFNKHVKFRKPPDYPYNQEYDLCISAYDLLRAIEEFRKRLFPDRLIG